VSKGTLSQWLKAIPYQPNTIVQQRIKSGPAKSVVIRRDKKLAAISKAKLKASREMGELSKRDLWMIGLGLYMGEGSKVYERIRIINSDPDLINLAIKWFKDVCGLANENFSIAIHTYPDVDESELKSFWSKKTGIPISQFGATQIDRREGKKLGKQGKLAFGTAHISIRCRGKTEHGVELHRRIMGWIEAVHKNLRV
jgi:hypothetical protein